MSRFKSSKVSPGRRANGSKNAFCSIHFRLWFQLMNTISINTSSKYDKEYPYSLCFLICVLKTASEIDA
jgi:hypothetical protein